MRDTNIHPRMAHAAFCNSRDPELREYDRCLWDVEGHAGLSTVDAICHSLDTISSVLRKLIAGEAPRGMKPHDAETLAVLERVKHGKEEGSGSTSERHQHSNRGGDHRLHDQACQDSRVDGGAQELETRPGDDRLRS